LDAVLAVTRGSLSGPARRMGAQGVGYGQAN
jgi:hypothetical protein